MNYNYELDIAYDKIDQLRKENTRLRQAIADIHNSVSGITYKIEEALNKGMRELRSNARKSLHTR